MEGIDWYQYHQLCVETTGPALDRFGAALRKAVGVATEQSTPIYAGDMRGSLITAVRLMTDILKQFAHTQLSDSQNEHINWKQTEIRMKEMYFLRLSEIENMQIAAEYVKERIQNLPSPKGQIYHWIYALQGNEKEVERIIRQAKEETWTFSKEDVPKIIELALLGIKKPR